MSGIFSGVSNNAQEQLSKYKTAAENFFVDYITEKTNDTVCGWADGFETISKKYKFIIFDDVSSVLSSEQFRKAFYDNMIINPNTRPFIIIIAEIADDLTGLADEYSELYLDYLSIPEVMKIYPTLSKVDILGLCAVSGGIPKVMKEYDNQKCFEDNLRNMLIPSFAFCNFMQELLSRYFRKPESYHFILYALANGNHSVSEIGKFTGFAYNKCDNYLSALISCGIVKAEKALSKRKAEKTVYVLANNYFRLWYLYVYRNQTEMTLGNEVLINDIISNIVEKEIHEFHLQKAFMLANERIRDMWSSFRISGKMAYSPKIIQKDDFSYTFDAVVRKAGKAIFIKIFADPLENLKKAELEKIRRAVTIVNKYYDSHIFVFSKRRFGDYAVEEAAGDDALSLVEVERLKF